MNEFVVSIGSNVADRDCRINEALQWLASKYVQLAVSKIYNSHALNGCDPDYLNAVMICSVEDKISISEVNTELKKYERSCGRSPQCKVNGRVPIDLDIVMWNNQIVRTKDFNCEFFRIGWNQLSLARQSK